MKPVLITCILLIITVSDFQIRAQENAFQLFLADSSMAAASVSLSVLNSETGNVIFQHDPGKSLIPASVNKLIISSAAIELLGPCYSFKTRLGYTGSVNKTTGKLKGDVVIIGGGDPALGSEYFSAHYHDFLNDWIKELLKIGITRIDGNIIVDDSRYDYQPVPAKWLWEDAGNYYGAGVYGLSVFNNTYRIHFRTSGEGSPPVVTQIEPDWCKYNLVNYLVASGDSDKGYVFAAPYSDNGWIAGTIPVNQEDFVLKAAIPDPPLFLAKLFTMLLDSSGIEITGRPTTSRIEKLPESPKPVIIAEVTSPQLGEIVEVLNHESVNLYAEHLLKEIGLYKTGTGTAQRGIEAVMRFLSDSGVDITGVFIEDGSGLSPRNSVTSGALAELIRYMTNKSENRSVFYRSLPEAGREGTLKYYFKNPAFDENLRAKSGSMARVRSYAGTFRAKSATNIVFSIIVNNFSGSSSGVVEGIENILLETILNN